MQEVLPFQCNGTNSLVKLLVPGPPSHTTDVKHLSDYDVRQALRIDFGQLVGFANHHSQSAIRSRRPLQFAITKQAKQQKQKQKHKIYDTTETEEWIQQTTTSDNDNNAKNK